MDEINLDFLKTPPKQNQSSGRNASPFVHNGLDVNFGSRKKHQRKRVDIAQNIAKVDELLEEIDKLKNQSNNLQQQLKDFHNSAKQVQELYAKEKREHEVVKSDFEKLQKDYHKIDLDLANKTMVNEQIKARLAQYEGRPINYDSLAVKYVRIINRLEGDDVLKYYLDKDVFEKLREYCLKMKLKIPPANSPKKSRSRINKTKSTEDFCVQCNLLVTNSSPQVNVKPSMQDQYTQSSCTNQRESKTNRTQDFFVQCNLLEANSIPHYKVKPTMQDQYTQSSCTKRDQASQYISTMITRQTNTERIVQKHVQTMFPEPQKTPAIDDILNTYTRWSNVRSVSPLLESPSRVSYTASRASAKTFSTCGTCTMLCNIRRKIDYLPPKHSSNIKEELVTPSASPTPSSNTTNPNTIRASTQTGSMSTSRDPNQYNNSILNLFNVNTTSALGQLSSSAFHELWQIFGKMLLSLLQTSNAGIANSQQNSAINQQQFLDWLLDLYMDSQSQNTFSTLTQTREESTTHVSTSPVCFNDSSILPSDIARPRAQKTVSASTNTEANKSFARLGKDSSIDTSTIHHIDPQTSPASPSTTVTAVSLENYSQDSNSVDKEIQQIETNAIEIEENNLNKTYPNEENYPLMSTKSSNEKKSNQKIFNQIQELMSQPIKFDKKEVKALKRLLRNKNHRKKSIEKRKTKSLNDNITPKPAALSVLQNDDSIDDTIENAVDFVKMFSSITAPVEENMLVSEKMLLEQCSWSVNSEMENRNQSSNVAKTNDEFNFVKPSNTLPRARSCKKRKKSKRIENKYLSSEGDCEEQDMESENLQDNLKSVINCHNNDESIDSLDYTQTWSNLQIVNSTKCKEIKDSESTEKSCHLTIRNQAEPTFVLPAISLPVFPNSIYDSSTSLRFSIPNIPTPLLKSIEDNYFNELESEKDKLSFVKECSESVIAKDLQLSSDENCIEVEGANSDEKECLESVITNDLQLSSDENCIEAEGANTYEKECLESVIANDLELSSDENCIEVEAANIDKKECLESVITKDLELSSDESSIEAEDANIDDKECLESVIAKDLELSLDENSIEAVDANIDDKKCRFYDSRIYEPKRPGASTALAKDCQPSYTSNQSNTSNKKCLESVIAKDLELSLDENSIEADEANIVAKCSNDCYLMNVDQSQTIINDDENCSNDSLNSQHQISVYDKDLEKDLELSSDSESSNSDSDDVTNTVKDTAQQNTLTVCNAKERISNPSLEQKKVTEKHEQSKTSNKIENKYQILFGDSDSEIDDHEDFKLVEEDEGICEKDSKIFNAKIERQQILANKSICMNSHENIQVSEEMRHNLNQTCSHNIETETETSLCWSVITINDSNDITKASKEKINEMGFKRSPITINESNDITEAPKEKLNEISFNRSLITINDSNEITQASKKKIIEMGFKSSANTIDNSNDITEAPKGKINEMSFNRNISGLSSLKLLDLNNSTTKENRLTKEPQNTISQSIHQSPDINCKVLENILLKETENSNEKQKVLLRDNSNNPTNMILEEDQNEISDCQNTSPIRETQQSPDSTEYNNFNEDKDDDLSTENALMIDEEPNISTPSKDKEIVELNSPKSVHSNTNLEESMNSSNISSLLSSSLYNEVLTESFNPIVDDLLKQEDDDIVKTPSLSIENKTRRGRKRKSESIVEVQPCKRSQRLKAKQMILEETLNISKTPIELGKYTRAKRNLNNIELPKTSQDKKMENFKEKCKTAENEVRIEEKETNEAALQVGFFRETQNEESKEEVAENSDEMPKDCKANPTENTTFSVIHETPNNSIIKKNVNETFYSVAEKEDKAHGIKKPDDKRYEFEENFVYGDSPQSPPSLAEEASNENISENFKIIPEERPAQFMPKLSNPTLFDNMFNSYQIENQKLLLENVSPKERQRQERILNQYDKELQSHCYTEMELDGNCTSIHLISRLLRISSDYSLLQKALITISQNAEESNVPENQLPSIIQEMPPRHLSKCLQRLYPVLSNIVSRDNNFCHDLMNKIESILFNSKQTHTISLQETLNLTQLYLMASKVQEQIQLSPHPARLFIAKSLYFYMKKSILMIHEVLMWYPTVLPHREDRTYDRSDALISVIQTLLMYNKYDMENPELRGKSLLSKLRYEYHFEPFKPSQEEVIQILVEKLNNSKFYNLNLAFGLLCKRLGLVRTQKFILVQHLLPLVKEYYGLALQTEVYDKRIAVLLELISMIVKPFPMETDVQMYFNEFSRFLNSFERQLIQEAAVCSILRLQRFDVEYCYSLLRHFQPNYDLNSHTQAMLKTFLYRRSLTFWKNLKSQNPLNN